MKSNWQSRWYWAIIMLWCGLLLGCSRPRPQPVVEVLTISPTATETAVSPIPNPTISAILAQITPTDIPTPAPTFTATPFICPTPQGWLRYVVQANDTLESLAQKTGTAVDSLKAANCLLNDIIIIGDPIFLPTLPPPPPPPVNIPLQTEDSSTVQACSPFSCPNTTLLALTLPGGSPNEGDPCLTDEITIETLPAAIMTGVRERGESVYFFACGFSDYSSVTAKLQGPNGVEILTPQPSQNIPDYQGNADIPYVNWGIKCDVPDGPYTVMITDAQEHTQTTTFTVGDPSFKRILAIPPFGAPGTSFDLYYCGYPPTTLEQDDEVINFYYALDRRETAGVIDYDWALSTSWTIDVSENGWVTNTLSSLIHDPVGAYLIMDQSEEGFRLLWLVDP